MRAKQIDESGDLLQTGRVSFGHAVVKTRHCFVGGIVAAPEYCSMYRYLLISPGGADT